MNPVDFAAENINEELEAKLLATPDDDSLWEAYGHWLVERGDARGRLVLLNTAAVSAPRDLADPLVPLVAPWNRARWFGELLGGEVSLTWFRGFPVTMEVADGPNPPDYTALFALRSCRYLRKVRLGAGQVDLAGVAHLPLLRRLSVGGSAENLASLPLWRPPSLDALKLELASLDENVVAAFASVPWMRELRSVDLGVLTPAQQEQLLERPEPFAALGRSLHFHARGEAWPAYGDRLLDALPEANIQPTEIKWEFEVSPRPYCAGRKYRERPPLEYVQGKSRCERGCCSSGWYEGSGIAFENPVKNAPYGPRCCMWCGSLETLVIYLSESSTFYRRDWDTVRHEGCEYECQKCGHFTRYSRTSVC